MSALNILKTQHEIHVVTDGCSYEADGRILGIGGKITPLITFPGFLATTGRSLAAPLLANVFPQRASNIDELFEQIEEIAVDFDRQFTDVLEGKGLGQAVIGGWSEAQQQMRIGSIAGSGSDHEEPYTVKIWEGDQLITTPPLSDDLQMQAFGSFFYSVKDALPVERFAKLQITAQRQMKFKLPAGEEGYGIGGCAQLTTITRDAVTSKVVARFPTDQVGGYIEPGPVDWKAMRSAIASDLVNAVAPGGMSKLKRDMLLRKAQKGKLKVVG